MDDTQRKALPGDLSASGANHFVLSDAEATAGAVRWLAEHYLMSEAFARILLGQLARQDGVSGAAAARSVLTTAVIECGPRPAVP